MKPQDVFGVILPEKAKGGTEHTLAGPEIPRGTVVELRTFYVADLTTVNRQMRLGFDKAGTQYWIQRHRAGASSFHISLEIPLILVGGERPFGYVEDPAAQDDLILVARGIYL